MPAITLSISNEVKAQMDAFPEINWSGFVKKAIIEKAKELTWKEEMLKKLKEEEKDIEWAVQMGRKVNKAMRERYEKEHEGKI